MRVIATPVIAKDLKPGELFSTAGPAWWGQIDADALCVGQRVYIRTNAAAENASDANEEVYRLTIVSDYPPSLLEAARFARSVLASLPPAEMSERMAIEQLDQALSGSGESKLVKLVEHIRAEAEGYRQQAFPGRGHIRTRDQQNHALVARGGYAALSRLADELEGRSEADAVPDEEPVEPDEPREEEVWSTYRIYGSERGFHVDWETNDDNDDGMADPAIVRDSYGPYRDLQGALQMTHGGSRFGVYGHRVTVFLDGRQIWTQGSNKDFEIFYDEGLTTKG
jgi:hypothetical protein